MRDALQELVERDLLGPWAGPEEAFKPRARGPRDRYLVGMLGPRPSETKSTREQADRQPDTESGVYGDGEAELPEVFTPQNLGKLWASSMGLTFTVGADVDVLAVRVEWGEYGSTQITTEDGKKATVWQRVPHAVVKEVRLDGEPSQRIGLRENEDPTKVPTIYLAAEVRHRDGRQVVQLVLVNGQIEPENKVDRAWVFQSRLTVTALDGAAPVFEPVDDPADGAAATPTPRTSTCGCSTGTSCGSRWGTTSPCTLTRTADGPSSSRRPGCPLTTSRPPRPRALPETQSSPWTRWPLRTPRRSAGA
ncbi:hypothetical protein ACFQV8_26535 [Pseudonocardia benzenivorans]